MTSSRKGFVNWIDKQPRPDWNYLPLTHISKGLVAEDIGASKAINPHDCKVLRASLSYFFYGRPAFRVGKEKVVKLELACPFCFLFKPSLIKRANGIHAFDTGAFAARLYRDVLGDEANIGDFSLGKDADRILKLIALVFENQTNYFNNNIVSVEGKAQAHEMLATAYLHLLSSPGRNEPDDRISAIEITFADPVLLNEELLAVVVPHTLWRDGEQAPWLLDLHRGGAKIVPYDFFPGKSPDYYHALLEGAVKKFYESETFL